MNPRVIILLSLAAVISAANEPIAIIKQEQNISPDGSFFTRWESANGITFEEQGVQKNLGQNDQAEEVRGSATWTAPDGQKINLGWQAQDENGAIFQGDHLPTPPPPPEIPPVIQRALDCRSPLQGGEKQSVILLTRVACTCLIIVSRKVVIIVVISCKNFATLNEHAFNPSCRVGFLRLTTGLDAR